MKLLWISPTPSHPQNAGNRAHIYAMAQKILAAGHSVSFLLYGQEYNSLESLKEMEAFWPEFYYVPHLIPRRKKEKVWRIDDWFNEDIEAAVRFLQSQKSFDIAFCEYVFFSKCLEILPHTVFKVLDCHDRMSNRAELLMNLGIEPDFFYTTPEEEKKALDRADLVLAIQEEEQHFFESLTQTPVLELGYPITQKDVTTRRRQAKLRVGYLASNNSLNQKSIFSFLKALRKLPEIDKVIEVVVAGSICQSLEAVNVTRLGVIENEALLYESVDIVINPMIGGTGLKIKTLSAISHGKPFLSMKAGTIGIPVTRPEHQCETLQELISFLDILLHHPDGIDHALQQLKKETFLVLARYQNHYQTQCEKFLFALAHCTVGHIKKKSVLLVTDVPFWEPGLGSHSRIFSLCTVLKKHFFLKIFFLGSLWKQREDLIKDAGFENIIVSYKLYEEKALKLNQVSDFPKITALERWRKEIFYKSLKLFLKSSPQFDVILFEYIWLAFTRAALPYPALTVLDSHDLMAYRNFRFGDLDSNYIPISLHDEISILEKFDCVLAIQYEEYNAFSALLKKAIPLCCPHSVITFQNNEKNLAGDKIYPLRFGFIGGKSSANSTALQWFLDNVWSQLLSLPISFNIYGSVCDTVNSSFANVKCHGIVSSITDIYNQCDVMVNPLIHGGGLKIKSVEALAYGKPLIASPEGAVGIKDPEKSGILVAKSRTEFINAILLFSENPFLCESFGAAAQQAAIHQFSPEVSFAPLIKMIEVL